MALYKDMISGGKPDASADLSAAPAPAAEAPSSAAGPSLHELLTQVVNHPDMVAFGAKRLQPKEAQAEGFPVLTNQKTKEDIQTEAANAAKRPK